MRLGLTEDAWRATDPLCAIGRSDTLGLSGTVGSCDTLGSSRVVRPPPLDITLPQ